ncbi:unnamed protein product [Paramecium sonneborni]|uniref:Uncharacterized protein n=1 Tax=Paramecium sonneborni TaxID=65129 RepID=A0A8S1Q099_9CILI|nr:unnamed protein product [Paramecium sonneborni]
MDQYSSAFQMLGQNMFSKAPSSGYSQGYHPMIQKNQNKQKFDQLIQLMQLQEQTVSDYNTRMKEKEDQLYQLEQQSNQLQRDLIQKDKQRNEHNQIHYKNYQPTFNVQNNVEIEEVQSDVQQQFKNLKQNKSMQGADHPEVQSQQMQRKASFQSNQNQTRPQTNGIQGNLKLQNMQKQIEEQNQYIQQLSDLVGNRKPKYDAEKEDSLTQLLNERDDLQKQQILNEIKQLKQRVDGYDQSRQQMIQQPFQGYGFMPQQQLLQQQGMMQLQNPYGMYPQMYPQNFQQQQQQSDESDENDLNNEILMKLIDQQNRQKKRGSRNRQNSQDQRDKDQRRDRRHVQKRKQKDDNNNNDGDGD